MQIKREEELWSLTDIRMFQYGKCNDLETIVIYMATGVSLIASLFLLYVAFTGNSIL